MSEKNEIDVLDILIAFIKGCKYKDEGLDNCIHSVIDNKDYWIWNTDYLLNQILRQINVPPERYLLSKGAKEMWKKLSPTGKKGDSITKYYYREVLTIQNDLNEEVGLYKGADSKPSSFVEIRKGNKFIFNDIFHLEHVIPIHVIKNQLLALDSESLTKKNVEQILSKMYVCRMLKSEDRLIDSAYKKNRPFDLNRILKEVYTKIEIVKTDDE